MKAKDLTLGALIITWGLIVDVLLGPIVETYNMLFIGLLFWKVMGRGARRGLALYMVLDLIRASVGTANVLSGGRFIWLPLLTLTFIIALSGGLAVSGFFLYLTLEKIGYYRRLEALSSRRQA